MRLQLPVVRILCVTAVLAGLGVVFFAVRPWYRGWGATAEERAMALPGDDIAPAAISQETRGITIQAPPERVFAWVAQIGQDRGGFYSYRILENVVGCEMPYVDRLDPRLEQWAVGDKLWMYPARKAGGIGHVVLRVLVPGRVLGFGDADQGSWTFVVRPTGDQQTRLLFRGRGTEKPSLLSAAFNVLGFEPMHFAMERRTLESVKELAEGGRPSELANNLQVLLWTVTFVCFVSSAVLVLVGRRPRRRLVTCAASGLLFLLLTLAQPPPLAGLPLVLALAAAVWWPRLRPVASGSSALRRSR